MISDELEFQISQYLDGALSPSDRAALEALATREPSVRRLIEQYRALDAQLRRMPALPEIRWEALSAHLSQAVRASEATDSIPMPWLRRIGVPLAAAASILIVIGVMLRWSGSPRPSGSGPDGGDSMMTALIEVTGPRAEAASGAALFDVQIGPASGADLSARFAEALVDRPSRVVWFAGGGSGGQDDARLPY